MLIPLQQKFKAILGRDKHLLASQLAEQLESLPAAESVNLSIKKFAELNAQHQLSPTIHIDCLYAIDHTAQAKLQELIAKRVNIKLINRSHAAAIDALVCPYFQHLFNEYQKFVTVLTDEKLRPYIKLEEMALLFRHALNAGLNVAKWQYFDDQPAPKDTWNQINRLYKIAENLTLLYVPIALYDEEIPSDFASDYAAGLMLSTLQTGSYRPVEYQVASELLLAWMRGATLERPYAKEKYQYCVNLHDDAAAVRIREFKRDADYRYWRTDYLSQHLQSVLIAFQEKNLPHGHPIKKLGTTRSIYGFIKKLALEWSPVHYQRQRRHAARASIEKTIEVAAGLEQVCKVLAKFSNNKYADTSTVTLSMNTSSADPNFTIPQTSETWTVIDESNTGFGVVMGMHPSAWIESGKLVGFKHPNQADVYVVAEIKNFRKQKNSIYRAGLHIIALHSLTIELNKLEEPNVELSKGFYLQENESEYMTRTRISCVWIPANDAHQTVSSTVIVPYQEYKQQREFKMRLNGEDKTLVLGPAVTVQAEWVRATIASVHE